MFKMKTTLLIAVVAVIFIAAAGIFLMSGNTKGKTTTPQVNGSSDGGIGMPNPASVYCKEQGGTTANIDTAAGQAGYCKFGDIMCDEWALFRSNGTNCTSVNGTAKTYIKNGDCVINFMCIRGTKAFKDAYGCGCEPDAAFSTGDNNSIGMPNPASVYCKEQGGKNITEYTLEGHAGYCRFAADITCDEWALFRSNGTNCTSPEGVTKTYLKKAPCVINFLCIRDMRAFSDAYGCGCEPDNTTAPAGNLGGVAGMANPASVYCKDQGGTLEIVDTTEGQVGMCHFVNGQICEEWALFRSNATNCTSADGTPSRTYCKPEQRQIGSEPKICTMEYHAVCGWTAAGVKNQTYSNPCGACIPGDVAYWTEGAC